MTLAIKRIRTTFILPFLFYGLFTFGQNGTAKSSVHQSIQSHTDAIYDSLVAIRRDFHRNPEVSDKEKRTAKKVRDYLLALGLEVKTDIGGHGVVGILKGAKEGKHIAWRADMDAIASDIPDVVDFSSENAGVRHICGHDVHTTIGMGIANVMASQRKNLEGTVYFVFQPSEENAKGAQRMISDGLFDVIEPDEIYALHMSPYPVGTIATKSENVFAHITILEVAYEASGNQDVLVNFTKELISEAQTHQPGTEFWDLRNIFSPEIGVTHPNTIYTDYVALMSDFDVKKSDDTLRIRIAVNGNTIEKLNTFLASIKNRIESSKYSTALSSVKFDFQKDMPIFFTPLNNKELTDKTMQSISSVYGEQSVIPIYGVGPFQFSDDFAHFQEAVPGTYFFLGGSNYEKGIMAMPHTPTFAVDEECIRTGVNYFSSMIMERLRE